MTDDNRCQYCAHPSDNGHHCAVRVRGDWYWGCGDSFRADGFDDAIKVGHRMTEAEIRDLDQEARDREEMIGLLVRIYKDGYDELWSVHDTNAALLARLGRLP